MSHVHGPGEGVHRDGAHGRRGASGGRLRWVLALTALFMVAEVVGGVVSGSLALLADAGHMLTDVGALALSLFAARLARRPPDADKTFGWVRVEILAALVNGAALLVIALVITWEAWGRLSAPVDVDAPVMLAVAGVGLLVNVAGALLLHGHAGESLNVRGAYLHVLGDLLGSVGALAAAGVILWTGWTSADPIISVLIALLILGGAWRLVREATDILLEGAPGHVDVEALLADLRAVEGLHDVHDLHVWTLTSGFVAMAGHGVVEDAPLIRPVLDAVNACAARHGVGHVTFQLEPRRLVQMQPRR